MELEESGGTGERPDPERSSAEIRQLLRKLDPQTGGGHKPKAIGKMTPEEHKEYAMKRARGEI